MNQDLKQQKIVITGGPCTGKTVLIEHLEQLGYSCFPEVIRLLTLNAKKTGILANTNTNPIATVADPVSFNLKILKAREAHFNQASELDRTPIFFDRGIPDVIAYMDFFKQEYGAEYGDSIRLHRYDIVFLLPFWEEIYQVDNERFESLNEARELYGHLRNTYLSSGYEVVEVPKASIDQRVAFLLKTIAQ